MLVDERGLPHGFKLSDLGSAHNLADHDYYRKTALTELPVRWMPPEALKAGIFTMQGDVWSFGVLAFEVVFQINHRAARNEQASKQANKQTNLKHVSLLQGSLLVGVWKAGVSGSQLEGLFFFSYWLLGGR